MKIRYQSRHGLARVNLPQLLGNELGKWSNGQERDVPDDLQLPVRMSLPDGPLATVKAVDAILHSGPDFVDASTGVNPDFACAIDGKETLDEGYPDPDGQLIPYEDENGNRLCVHHYLLTQPQNSYAWTRHLSVERGPERHVATLAELQKRDAEKPADAPAPTAVSPAAKATSLPPIKDDKKPATPEEKA